MRAAVGGVLAYAGTAGEGLAVPHRLAASRESKLRGGEGHVETTR